LFDYEGWPKRIGSLFPSLPGHIDSAFHFGENYFFTKEEKIWKYKPISSYPPLYELAYGYPKQLREEYPYIPFSSVDAAFSISDAIFFFKDYEFWQSEWASNITGKVPIKVNAAVGWRNPRVDSSLNEPLAYLISNNSMYKFQYWSLPLSQESIDIRYFLFDCVNSNYNRQHDGGLASSYKQAFAASDNQIYNNNNLMRWFPRMVKSSSKRVKLQNEKQTEKF
jgi:hypothetical protein